MAEQLPEDLLRTVTPADAQAYALASGWQRIDGVRGQIAVFRPVGDDSFVQVTIPLRNTTEDYAHHIAEAIQRFANREERPLAQVLNDLLAAGTDFLRFQVGGPQVSKGMVPFNDGFKLYEGARDSLLAAACGAIDPKKHYPRVRRAAEDFLKACRMGQTERSSYVATVACPANALPERHREGVPFGRQTTGLLLNTMAVMTRAIERHDEESLLEVQEEDAVVSANMCDAILEMQPEDERTTLKVQCTWSRSVQMAADAPAAVTFKREYRGPIKQVADALRPPVEPRPVRDYIGTISALRSEPNIVRRELGEVVMFVSDQGQAINVRVELTPADYAKACVAHKDGRAVLVRGILQRGPRIARIEHPRVFQIVDGGDRGPH